MTIWFIEREDRGADGEAYYWSDEKGWVCPAFEGMIFTDLGKESCTHLPAGGKWVKRNPMNSDHYDGNDDQIGDLMDLVSDLRRAYRRVHDAVSGGIEVGLLDPYAHQDLVEALTACDALNPSDEDA